MPAETCGAGTAVPSDMLKKILWAVVILIVGAAAIAYFDKDFRNQVLEMTGQLPTSTKVYKWQDNKGIWHVSNTPPRDKPYKEQEYLHNTNVIPSLPAREAE